MEKSMGGLNPGGMETADMEVWYNLLRRHGKELTLPVIKWAIENKKPITKEERAYFDARKNVFKNI